MAGAVYAFTLHCISGRLSLLTLPGLSHFLFQVRLRRRQISRLLLESLLANSLILHCLLDSFTLFLNYLCNICLLEDVDG